MSLDDLARLTEGYSGADIKLLCRDAAMSPMRAIIAGKSAAEIRALKGSDALDFALRSADFAAALDKIKPSVDTKEAAQFAKWQKEFGSL